MAILITLLAIWTDKVELLFNDTVLLVEFIKITACSITSIIAMRIAVVYFRKRNITGTRTKMMVSSILTLLISSYLYISYFINIADHNIINRQFRMHIAAKTTHTSMRRKANHLSYKEYAFIAEMMEFNKINNKATDISFTYEYDGFLPDYYLSISYYLPKGEKVATMDYQTEDFSQTQTIDTLSDKLKVDYCETLK